MCVLLAIVLLLQPASSSEIRVLFVGNSLTYSNDLPRTLERIADANGRRLEARTIAYPDYALEDHVARRDAMKEIAKGGWNVVVLQQGPSGAPENRANLIEYAKRFDAEIRKTGGRTALYQVWPSTARFGDFDRVCESYRLAADAVDGILFPVGEAWRDAMRHDESVALYSDDGLHPSREGSLLAALVMYERLYDEPPARLPSTGIPEARVALLRDAASRVCRAPGLRANHE